MARFIATLILVNYGVIYSYTDIVYL